MPTIAVNHPLVFAVALVAVLAMFWPAVGLSTSSDTSPEFARITDYRATFDVDADGTLRAHETLTVDLPLGRHGIFRFWDVSDPTDSHVRLVPENISVSLDGRSEAMEL